eukprot:5327290-Amphidinium_carterae.1
MIRLPKWMTLPPTTRTRTPPPYGQLLRTRDPKVPTPLWSHSHLGGETSAVEGRWSTLCWNRAPTEHLCSDPSRCLRQGRLRWRNRCA